jgi:hypothetical protein
MPPPEALQIGSGKSERSVLPLALPGCVVVGAFVSLAPIALYSDGLLMLVHVPTFLALLDPAVVLTVRARNGQRVSPIAIAAVVGGLVASVALMLVPAVAVQSDPKCSWVYGLTWVVLPVLGLVGSSLAALLAAAVVGLAWLPRRWRARGQRSRSASCF